ncbi:patatin-like phospholipase family protein [Brevundimonas sp. CEF1]|uniref:patatin-like phospholipase family protein n=1 Tax=Brevundimonas sp. CEF1 TaxID=3442642 RepID=UPI003F51AA91
MSQPVLPVRRLPKGRLPAPPSGLGRIEGFSDIRLSVEQAEASLEAAADRLSLPRSGWSSGRFDMLAISGGAAGGAYGAGALVGLTEAGARPEFALVTGVSTGALIAPFAFLGAAWDERLADAYVGGHAADLLSLRRLASTFTGGLFQGEALDGLIHPFVDEALIDAVAAEHARGRRLLVATTDLDSQRSCIWDMGAIASHGGEKAVALFREVLAASASLPGLFPPRRIPCEVDGDKFEEMHVDGGVAAPLFLMPEGLLRWNRLGRRLHRGRVHVLVNTVLEPEPRTTAPNVAAVLTRSFDAMLRFSYRQALGTATTFCAAQGLPISVASIPDAPDQGGMLSFDTATMQRLFDAARERARAGELWRSPVAERQGLQGLMDRLRPRG